MEQPHHQPNSTKRKRIRDWEEAETSALLERVNMPKFRHQKRKQYYMKWDAIAADIQSAEGSDPAVITGKRCNERMKTLRGCYEKVTTERKEAGVTEGEWRKSKGIAVDWWYDAIGEFCGPRKGKLKDRTAATEINVSYKGKSMDRTPATETGVSFEGKSKDRTPATKAYVSSGSAYLSLERGLAAPATEINVSCIGKSMDRTPATITYATRFNSLTKLQRSTLLDLHFFAEYFGSVLEYAYQCPPPLWMTCERLSSMQNRTCLAIYEDVIAVQKMGLLRGKSDDEEGEGSGDDEEVHEDLNSNSRCSFSGLLAHETFFQKAVAEDRNPAYDTRRTIMDNALVTFDATWAPSRTTMLFLHKCEGLEVVDMSGFRQLRFLSIFFCWKLREMIGWECLEELRCLEVLNCRMYHGYPPLQKMPSLQEFDFYRGEPFSEDFRERVNPGGELDVSGCVRLRRLEIWVDSALSSIRGLEGLRSLTLLQIRYCKALRKLPDVGHMKDLTYFTIFGTCVKVIKGVERLSSLKELDCRYSKLKTLPDLSHLPYLQGVYLEGCPVVDDPSSFYYNHASYREFNHESRHVDVSDIE